MRAGGCAETGMGNGGTGISPSILELKWRESSDTLLKRRRKCLQNPPLFRRISAAFELIYPEPHLSACACQRLTTESEAEADAELRQQQYDTLRILTEVIYGVSWDV